MGNTMEECIVMGDALAADGCINAAAFCWAKAGIIYRYMLGTFTDPRDLDYAHRTGRRESGF